jgi:hypothetical protein
MPSYPVRFARLAELRYPLHMIDPSNDLSKLLPQSNGSNPAPKKFSRRVLRSRHTSWSLPTPWVFSIQSESESTLCPPFLRGTLSCKVQRWPGYFRKDRSRASACHRTWQRTESERRVRATPLTRRGRASAGARTARPSEKIAVDPWSDPRVWDPSCRRIY